jgi:hypothetical protein
MAIGNDGELIQIIAAHRIVRPALLGAAAGRRGVSVFLRRAEMNDFNVQFATVV